MRKKKGLVKSLIGSCWKLLPWFTEGSVFCFAAAYPILIYNKGYIPIKNTAYWGKILISCPQSHCWVLLASIRRESRQKAACHCCILFELPCNKSFKSNCCSVLEYLDALALQINLIANLPIIFHPWSQGQRDEVSCLATLCCAVLCSPISHS